MRAYLRIVLAPRPSGWGQPLSGTPTIPMRLFSNQSPLAYFGAALLAFAGTAQAQINKPAASPRAQLTQQVGLTTVNVDYSRPGVKGRKIFGELEAYGAVWRTGANACTTIEFANNAMVAGQEVPAGKYSMFTIPEKDKWTFILNKNVTLWGAAGYDPKEDLMRVEVPVQVQSKLRETLTIDFENFHTNGADLTVAWENVAIAVPIVVESDALVFAEIDAKVIQAKGPISARTYFDAAMFYYEKGKDLPKAAEWLDKAVEMTPEAFWQVYYQAELALALGNKDKAKSCVEASMKLAKESPTGDFGYVAKGAALLEKIQAK